MILGVGGGLLEKFKVKGENERMRKKKLDNCIFILYNASLWVIVLSHPDYGFLSVWGRGWFGCKFLSFRVLLPALIPMKDKAAMMSLGASSARRGSRCSLTGTKQGYGTGALVESGFVSRKQCYKKIYITIWYPIFFKFFNKRKKLRVYLNYSLIPILLLCRSRKKIF